MGTSTGINQLVMAERTLLELKNEANNFPIFARKVERVCWKLEDIQASINDDAVTEETEVYIESLTKEINSLQSELEVLKSE